MQQTNNTNNQTVNINNLSGWELLLAENNLLGSPAICVQVQEQWVNAAPSVRAETDYSIDVEGPDFSY